MHLSVLYESAGNAKPPYAPRRVVQVAFAWLVLLAVTATAAPPGDAREGYESPQFATASRQLQQPVAIPLDLHELYTRPPLGLGPVPEAASIVTPATIALGRRLFFDRRLSFNGTLSCGMCHVPEQAFAQNELRTPVGFQGSSVRRNAPSLLNVAYRSALFADGRETSLETQVWSPLLAPNEMANPSVGFVLARVASIAEYEGAFEAAYGRGVSMELLGAAVASYERALLAGNSAFDRTYFGAEPDALSEAAGAGFVLFKAKGCGACHRVDAQSAPFTDDEFHDTGIGYRQTMGRAEPLRRLVVAPGVELTLAQSLTVPEAADLGRYEITSDPIDRYRFRTPSLRNVALTAPYMHDGSVATLQEVIEYYDRGGVPHPTQDPRIRPLQLTLAERASLVAFLVSLTGDGVDRIAADARSVPIGD
jgi:cytochrome c peroxidase